MKFKQAKKLLQSIFFLIEKDITIEVSSHVGPFHTFLCTDCWIW